MSFLILECKAPIDPKQFILLLVLLCSSLHHVVLAQSCDAFCLDFCSINYPYNYLCSQQQNSSTLVVKVNDTSSCLCYPIEIYPEPYPTTYDPYYSHQHENDFILSLAVGMPLNLIFLFFQFIFLPLGMGKSKCCREGHCCDASSPRKRINFLLTCLMFSVINLICSLSFVAAFSPWFSIPFFISVLMILLSRWKLEHLRDEESARKTMMAMANLKAAAIPLQNNLVQPVHAFATPFHSTDTPLMKNTSDFVADTELVEFLKKNDLLNCLDILVSESIDFAVLMNLSEAEMASIGLNLGTRKRLLIAMKNESLAAAV